MPNQVIEIDYGGSIVWMKGGLNQPSDAERLHNGNTLISEMYGNRVIEVNSVGDIVWQYTDLIGPWDVERLPNGNTLITDAYMNRVIEVDYSGTIVWQRDGLNMPVDAERLSNGNTLIAETAANRVIEVDISGAIVWQYPCTFPVDVERLPNGNTLITLYSYENFIIEIDNSGAIIWEYLSNGLTFDAERLANGNTLITELYLGNGVFEIDSNGTIVWQKTDLFFPTDAERLSEPPEIPTIDGKTNGKTGKDYEYTFNSADPEGDDVRFYIEWGDNNTEWTDYASSGTDINVKHNWTEKGTYLIRAKAVDAYGADSDWVTLEVNMPRFKSSNIKYNLLELFLKRSLNAFPVIRYLLGF